MNVSNIKNRRPGVIFDKNGVADILIWAPSADNVGILLLPQNRKLSLEKKELGYWGLLTSELQPGDLYKFVINEYEELPDPASLSQPEGVHGASQAIDLENFVWNDKFVKSIPLQDYIIYELHTGTFTPEGTFSAIEEKLDYFVDLGITAIEIMPVSQFPGSRNWGYDGVLPYCVQNSYGGAEALQHLVDACHSKGLAVILDVVYNHLGPEGNYFGSFGPFFTDKYHTPWGDAINFDDKWSDGVRQYFIENAVMWFRDFHIDGLRMDAVHAIKDFSPVHVLQEIRQRTDQLMEVSGKKHYLIVEMDLNDTRFINRTETGGYGMDAQWIDEFHHSLRVASGQEKTGYYSDFEPISSLAKSYKDAYVYDGIYSEHRKRKFGVKADQNAGEQFIVFSQNHDHVGNRMLGERTSQLVSFEMQKLLAGAVMASPFLPMLFMGEEWAESNPFQYFVSHTDPELAEAVRKGRKEEFAAFHIEGEAPDPMAEETFENSKLQWDLLSRPRHEAMFRFYKKLIALKKTNPVLKLPDRKGLTVSFDVHQGVIILNRIKEDHHIVIVMNFSKDRRETQFPAHVATWFKLISSADVLWDGPQMSSETMSSNSPFQIQPESFAIYTNQPL